MYSGALFSNCSGTGVKYIFLDGVLSRLAAETKLNGFSLDLNIKLSFDGD